MPDGTVETVVEGEEEKLNEYMQWCKKGSSSARVDEVQEEWETPTGEFKAFSIKY